MARECVGLIGVGLLGTALAEGLLREGFDVLGYDLSPERRAALAALGGHAEESAADVAAACRRLVLCLPTSADVEAVLAEVAPQLTPGAVVVDTTTGAPERTEAIGREREAHGVSYLDATISGSSAQVRSRDAVLMVGGTAAAFAACTDLFACWGRAWFHLGGWGAGARMKLVSNLVLGLNRAVLAEGLAFAQACGLDPARALEVLQAGAASSRVMETKGRKMIERDFAPQARLAQHLKDVRLILAEGERTGAALPLSSLHRELLERLIAAGLGDADNAAIIDAFEGRPSTGTTDISAPHP